MQSCDPTWSMTEATSSVLNDLDYIKVTGRVMTQSARRALFIGLYFQSVPTRRHVATCCNDHSVISQISIYITTTIIYK